MNRLIITGAGGFLGTNVIAGVLEDNFFAEIIALTRGVDQLKDRLPKREKLHIFEANAIETGDLKLGTNDLVLNCAYPRAIVGPDVTAGLDYVESIFQAAADANAKGIVNISSQSVYDPQRDHPAVETDIPVLTDEYAIGKYCIEMLLRNICKDIPHTNIRLASLIGPGFDARVPNKMVKSALETGEITVQINDQHFGFLDVEDAVRGLSALLKLEPHMWKTVYNLGSERTYTLIEMAECIAEIVKDTVGKRIDISKTDGNGALNSALANKLLNMDAGEYQHNNLMRSIKKIVETFCCQINA